MGYTSAQAKIFVSEIGPIVQKYAKKYGYQVASPIIAQAICESAAGTSGLSAKYHNYFGLKAGSGKEGTWGVWDGTVANLSTKEEYKPGQLTTIKDYFRVYKDMDAGVHGYFEFMNYARYKNLKTTKTPLQYLNMVKADGYCTSSTYVNTCNSLISKYDLTKYDWNDAADASDIDKIAREVIDGKWGTGNVRRQRLEKAGYDYAVVQKRVNDILSK